MRHRRIRLRGNSKWKPLFPALKGLERSRVRALRLRSVEDLSLDNPEIVS
jgi:hypothetical protein